MMKRVLLGLILVLLLAFSASAAEMKFPKFKVNVPDGWTTTQDGETVALFAPGNAAAVSIVRAGAENKNAETLAKEMSKELKGTEPTGSDGAYMFTFNNKSGVQSQCILTVEDNEFVMITVTGSHPQVAEILESLSDN